MTARINQSRFSMREGFIEETLVLCDDPPAAGRGGVPAAIQVSLRNLQVLRLGERAVAVSGEVMAAQGLVEFQ